MRQDEGEYRRGTGMGTAARPHLPRALPGRPRVLRQRPRGSASARIPMPCGVDRHGCARPSSCPPLCGPIAVPTASRALTEHKFSILNFAQSLRGAIERWLPRSSAKRVRVRGGGGAGSRGFCAGEEAEEAEAAAAEAALQAALELLDVYRCGSQAQFLATLHLLLQQDKAATAEGGTSLASAAHRPAHHGHRCRRASAGHRSPTRCH